MQKSIEDGKNKNTAISECSNANLIVAKTIRLRRDKFEEWKRKEGSLDWLKVRRSKLKPSRRTENLPESSWSHLKSHFNPTRHTLALAEMSYTLNRLCFSLHF